MAISTPPPQWIFRPLPANSLVDEKLLTRIQSLSSKLPGTFPQLYDTLTRAKTDAGYDVAANLATELIWPHLDDWIESPNKDVRCEIAEFAIAHFVPDLAGRVCRRLAKDRDPTVRATVSAAVKQGVFREVALPATKDGPWDASGWLKGVSDVDLSDHKTGKKIQEKNQVPAIKNLEALRKLLGIRSEAQLGYFLLATDRDNGPYVQFSIPKRDGTARKICAPKAQLKWVQRQIHAKILDQVPAHSAAHGFIVGRSTVTNAAQHVGAKLLLKFDLKDFFPTIHYYRVLGLFANLGYTVPSAKFANSDDSKQVAPTLARLCCYTPDPKAFYTTTVPQGAPTSPAISNLVCRRLDSRLHGLATRANGIYTRYADDLTFSFRDPKDLNIGRYRWWVDQICQQEGFQLNNDKFRVIRGSQRQMVTGIVVNSELRIPRETRRQFRAMLHNCRQTSVREQSKGNPRFAEYLRGFASYVNMVHPEEGVDLLEQVNELLGIKPGEPDMEAPESTS